MNKRREVKPIQRYGSDRQLEGDRTRSKDSGQGDSESSVGRAIRSRREQWSEESVYNYPLETCDLAEMSKNRNKDKGDEHKEEADEVPQHVTSGADRTGGSEIAALMQMWMEESRRRDDDNRRREEEQRRRDEERREDSKRKEDEWRLEMAKQREDAENREERLLGKLQAQIEAASRPIPTRSRQEPLNLPKLTTENSLDTFISTFEAQLSLAEVPKHDWKLKLIGQLDEQYRVQISDIIENLDSTYDEMVDGLRKASVETSTSATQRFFAPESADLSKFTDTTKALRVVNQWAERMTEGLNEKKEVLAAMCRARVRTWHNDRLRGFVNQKEIVTNSQLINRVAEWKAETRDECGEFVKQGSKKSTQGMIPGFGRKQGVCYPCGKAGHYARECRRTGKSSTDTSGGSSASTISTEESTKAKVETKVVKCYGCGETGHKKPECPRKKKTSVVKLGPSRVLRRNEMLATVGGITMPITLDMGAEVSVLPREADCVKKYTGETVTLRGVFDDDKSITAPLAEAELVVGGEVVNTIAAMVEGEYINWEGALAFDTDNDSALELFKHLNDMRVTKYKGDRKYSPVMLTDDGNIQGAVMWADIPKHVKLIQDITDEPEPQGGTRLRILSCETDEKQLAPDIDVNQKATRVQEVPLSEGRGTQPEQEDRGEPQQIPDSGDVSAAETSVGSSVEVLGDDDVAYEEVEEEGVQGDCADSIEEDTRIKTLEMTVNKSKDELVKATRDDHSLDNIKKLADREENG